MWSHLVYCAGIAALLSFALRTLLFLYANFFKAGVDLKKYATRGDWAVVTGATDGIGKA